MKSLRIFDRQAQYIVLAVTLLLAAIVPAFASAAQVTERSIALSSAAQDATGVAYQINFTATGAAGAFVVEFCSNTPLIGEACTAPTGFSAAGAASADSDVISITKTATKINVETAMTAAELVSIDVTGITNPTVTGPLYARIVTYDTMAHTSEYATTSLGAHAIDQGAVALYINDNVNVSGAVLETMTFCVSGQVIAANCVGGGANAPSLTAPTLVLGKDTAGVIALASDDVYEGTIYSQISTNASKGAVISLKSNAIECGGLIRSSDPDACDIGPASGDIANGEPEFGVKLGADVTDPTDGDLVAAGSYSSLAFAMNWVSGDATGVTSPYGDPILETNEKPANNRNMPLTFGASVSNNTPAGNYSAVLSLIATGKF